MSPQNHLFNAILPALTSVDMWAKLSDRQKIADAIGAYLNEHGVNNLPVWEAVYEPGNVSDYLIGYCNDEVAAKAAAEAWLRSQAADLGALRWDEFRLDANRFGYDVEYLLREVADDGTDTESGVRVQRRIKAGETS